MYWVISALVLLSLALILLWHYTFRPADAISSLDAVQREYMTALKMYNIGTLQQLASSDSKATLLPSWLSVVESHQTGEAIFQGNQVEIPYEFRLSPSPGAGELLSITQKSAVANTYRIPLYLHRDHGGWRVDQRALLERLREEMQAANPNVQFPPWE